MPATVKDMMGREIVYEYPPARIISLVPSQTELLYDLGLEAQVVGITKFCVHPDHWFRSKTRVGGTKKLHLDIIRSLQPDLVIANKEENTQEEIEALAKEFPVWISDIRTVEDGLEMIGAVGSLVGKADEARNIIRQLREGFSELPVAGTAKKVAYFIWYHPWMTIGHDTFINSMIGRMGWKNVFDDKTRYPEISLEELAAAKPEIVLLSSEPFPFKQKHIDEIKAVLPEAEVLLVDGELFSWYGSRMIKAIPYLSSLVQNDPTHGKQPAG